MLALGLTIRMVSDGFGGFTVSSLGLGLSPEPETLNGKLDEVSPAVSSILHLGAKAMIVCLRKKAS